MKHHMTCSKACRLQHEKIQRDLAREISPTLYRFAIGIHYYIASSLSNAAAVMLLRDELKVEGHVHTYDWTGHGAVFKDGATRDENVKIMQKTALAEAEGVTTADVVIVMLPGGKGTHVELGMALALKKPVIMVSDVHPYHAGQEHNDQRNFPCACWFHPLVRHAERGEAVKAVRELTVELRNKPKEPPGPPRGVAGYNEDSYF